MNECSIALGEVQKPLRMLSRPEISKQELEDIAGLYRFGPDFYVPGATMRVAESDGQLIMPAESPFPMGGLLPLADGTFIHRQQWFRVSFKKNSEGQVTGMKYGPFEAKKEME